MRVKGGNVAKNRRKKILKLANIDINRKMLSEIAINDEAGFKQLVETAKKSLAQ